MDKRQFREYCKKRLFEKRVTRKVHKTVEENLRFLLDRLQWHSALVFLPMKHEPNLQAFFSNLRKHKYIFVPFMQGESFKMVKFRLPLKEAKFGIKEAPNSFFQKDIDIAIIPVIGVDGDFRRVGFGKGMYDKFFAKLKKKPITIFVQVRTCLTSRNVCDRYDVRGDFLVTPKKIYIRGDSYVGRDFSRKFCGDSKRRCRILSIKKNRKRQTQNI